MLFGKFGSLAPNRTTLVVLAIFLLLACGSLGLDAHLASRLEQDAVGVDLAGRQRLLSQRITDNLLAIEAADAEGRVDTGAYTALQTSLGLFDSTLEAFGESGLVRDAVGEQVFLAAAKTPESVAILRTAEDIWRPLRSQIQAVLDHRGMVPNPHLSTAVSSARAQGIPLLKQMNDLTIGLERRSRDMAQWQQGLQTAGILLALLLCWSLVLSSVRRLPSEQVSLASRG